MVLSWESFVCFATLEHLLCERNRKWQRNKPKKILNELKLPAECTEGLQSQPDTAVFVSWHKRKSKSSHDEGELRGCIGTFEPSDCSSVLIEYTMASAFQDYRFEPIKESELPLLQCSVTKLSDFEDRGYNKYDWDIGAHGIRISFIDHGRRVSATYLPYVIVEQRWTKEQALMSLCRKAGWHGSASDLESLRISLTRYKGVEQKMSFQDYRALTRQAVPRYLSETAAKSSIRDSVVQQA